MTTIAAKQRADNWLPQFCSSGFALPVLLVSTIALTIIQLAPSSDASFSASRYSMGLVFVLALSSASIALLCALRPLLLAVAVRAAVLVTFLVVFAVATVGSALIYWMDLALGLGGTVGPDRLYEFVFGNASAAAIIWAVMLRYFYVREQWQREVKAQARLQFLALQARIRPHFLFNSMNTIASLIRTSPLEAERAVVDLSDLFRAALTAGDADATLQQELELSKRYLDIEALRLGSRLNYEINCESALLNTPMPNLLLQPLVENAVVHGIQRLEQGGTVVIDVSNRNTAVDITIRNPTPVPPSPARGGTGTAIDNVAQRIRLRFGGDSELRVAPGSGTFAVSVRIPRP